MKISNMDIARAIDFINEYAIHYYSRKSEKVPNIYTIHSELYEKYRIDLTIYEHAIRIMKMKGLISYITCDQDENIKEFKHTDKGLLLLLNGGMVNKLQRKTEVQQLKQRQIRSVIKTNRIQKIALSLSVFLTLMSLLFLVHNDRRIKEIKINQPVEVFSIEAER